jgi:hypothetical protein
VYPQLSLSKPVGASERAVKKYCPIKKTVFEKLKPHQ